AGGLQGILQSLALRAAEDAQQSEGQDAHDGDDERGEDGRRQRKQHRENNFPVKAAKDLNLHNYFKVNYGKHIKEYRIFAPRKLNK
ncbi:MAG: hypothetical protein IIW83_02585, partial [Clostridia bacterium]|nr:hypothetical protein [Clostridia bacterium]